MTRIYGFDPGTGELYKNFANNKTMWIVNLALRRPYTFIVLAIFILIGGVLSILSAPKDIFPSINIPVISVIWNYTGSAPRDVADHLTTPYERVLTTTVDNIEHI